MHTKSLLKTDWPVWILLLLPFVVIAVYWNQLPEELPSHWNAAGEVDDYSRKGFIVFLMPVIAICTYLLLLAVPYIDPKRKTSSGQKALRVFRLVTPLLMLAIFAIIFAKWLGYDFHIGRPLTLSLILLFFILGNYLITVKPNYFIGIRTPWTLESEDIWRKTHRLGGWLWVVCSTLMLIAWFFVDPERMISLFVGVVIAMSLIPVGYSFYLYFKDRDALDEETLT